jgi:hypothetical protein
MTQPHNWLVNLHVTGPFTIQNQIQMRQQKGFNPAAPFYSDITINPSMSGFRALVTARAQDEHLAYQAAVFFFGRMLDVLALELFLPMYLNLTERTHRSENHDVRRIIQKEELETAFIEARRLGENYPTYLRSLGWFRKGLYTDDPFDRYLAFWNSVEQTAARYYKRVDGIDLEHAKKGSKNQIYGCFLALWGDDDSQWEIILGDDKWEWIKDSYAIRNNIAHGIKDVTIDNVKDVVDELPALQNAAHKFLTDWGHKYSAGPLSIPAEQAWATSEPSAA